MIPLSKKRKIKLNTPIYDSIEKDVTYVSGIFGEQIHLSVIPANKMCIINNDPADCKCDYWIDKNSKQFYCFSNDAEKTQILLGMDTKKLWEHI